MKPLRLRELGPRPRASASSPAYPALLCAALATLAVAGCYYGYEDDPDAGDDAAGAEEAEAGSPDVDDGAADAAGEADAGSDMVETLGCTCSPFRSAPSRGAAGLAGVVLLGAVGVRVRRRRR